MIISRLITIGLAGSIAAVVATNSSDPAVGKPAPDFRVVDTRGNVQQLSAQRGKWVVLEWFSHACPFTGKQYNTGAMQRLQREYTARGVTWISVVSSAPGREGYTTTEQANALTLKKGASPTAVIRDTTGALGHLYGARNTPNMFVIDPAGTLVYAGAIDDKRTTDTADVRTAHTYVRAALEEGMSGKPISTPATQPYGCTVQYATP
jgi:peroxiredoxin